IKAAVAADVKSEAMFEFGQQMVDTVFSFGELGFQETETARYLTGILEREGFTVERGVAGIPTAWVARWGSGKPVIALGSDVDGIPQASQKPGVAYRDPVVDGAPGHGEGHNSGTPLNIVAAIAAKRAMARDKVSGTLVIWPGVAEELVGTKAYYVRAGLFKDVDVVLYNHVGTDLVTSWGEAQGNGLVSVEYTFLGESAHSAGAPWRGKSALDAVELMNAGWNARREHLRIQQRSHYVITNGGDQPNVVPRNAGVWYYFRETNYENIKRMWEIGDKMAQGAALMTDTTFTSRVLGSAWPQHYNKPLALTMHENIKAVGLPTWSEADVTLATATQTELGVPVVGLTTTVSELKGQQEIPDDEKRGGGSDDIGDISWTVPTVSLRFPANFQAGPGHNWANAITMATPIAHKGVNHGAQVLAMTVVDLLLRPDVVASAKDYFTNVQTKDRTYAPLIRASDTPAIELNKGIMDKYRPAMKKFYYDSKKYKTYLEQLGITYPTVRTPSTAGSAGAPQ
ncbi:MAG: peptidase dimerization domain-containing protein, partial [Acidobacteria bacterium]|nr:peptidase dimerization domain-containing protein [Acidobacteriota bacterium]